MENNKLVVGLGNPGRRYEATRHNIGFLVLDELARRKNLDFFVEEEEYWCSGKDFSVSSLVLMKPLTYMNLSGEALLAWAERSHETLTGSVVLAPSVKEDLPESDSDADLVKVEDPAANTMAITEHGLRPLIICDDLALPLGAVRLRAKGSSGGQNGVQSVIECLDGDVFPRLRLGIAPVEAPVDPEFWPDYVLAEFEPDELPAVKDVVHHAADAVEFWLKSDTQQTASRFNRRRIPDSNL